jgi:hypothetical protein
VQKRKEKTLDVLVGMWLVSYGVSAESEQQPLLGDDAEYPSLRISFEINL